MTTEQRAKNLVVSAKLAAVLFEVHREVTTDTIVFAIVQLVDHLGDDSVRAGLYERLTNELQRRNIDADRSEDWLAKAEAAASAHLAVAGEPRLEIDPEDADRAQLDLERRRLRATLDAAERARVRAAIDPEGAAVQDVHWQSAPEAAERKTEPDPELLALGMSMEIT